MAENKTYRIHTTGEEEYVDVNLNINQDIDVFEMLTLKINTENFYKLHTSNYGCVAGRVLANNAIGVPNVRLSIFIAADEETSADSVLSYLYPYNRETDSDDKGIRYNLLTEEQISDCHRAVGTFPTKTLVLDDDNVFEIFDKYYKFTTTTNAAGDYMIFGVPTGSQTLHMDVDLSDIGDMLSQNPRDFIYKGYDISQFESPVQFKTDTALETLPQIISQNDNVYVYPFWGDPSEMGEADATGVRITRKDITLNYKFEPTCVFMGSLLTDEKSNGFSKRCIPTERMGKMDRLTTGEGTIEMIRKTPDGQVESYNVSGAHLIDGDGVWCYQIPMNLDYVCSDEYGNIVPTDNPNKGIPTRTRVRFRFSLNDFASDAENNHLSKMLVPSNPQSYEELKPSGLSSFYAFGTYTKEEEFRDLLWNKVYSVKSYIPRLQKGNADREKRFSGFKAVNVNGGNNPTPYNNMRIDITFMFILQCSIMNILIWITTMMNKVIGAFLRLGSSGVKDAKNTFYDSGSCLTVGDGACPDLEGWYFAPGCETSNKYNVSGDRTDETAFTTTFRRLQEKNAGDIKEIEDTSSTDDENRTETNFCLSSRIEYFKQCIEIALAQEYEVIQFDFYNDWLNGVLYIPRWFATLRKKRTFLWGTLVVPEKVRGCMESTFGWQRRYVQQGAFEYDKNNKITTNYGCANASSGTTSGATQNCHRGRARKSIKIVKKSRTKPGGGYVHQEQNISDKKYAYYFRPCDFGNDNDASSSKNKRINYFLTDIILLGSLNEKDTDGVPMAFKSLTSSTYRMPTNIAATNMDTVGWMYGAVASGGTRCGGERIDKYSLKLTLAYCKNVAGRNFYYRKCKCTSTSVSTLCELDLDQWEYDEDENTYSGKYLVNTTVSAEMLGKKDEFAREAFNLYEAELGLIYPQRIVLSCTPNSYVEIKIGKVRTEMNKRVRSDIVGENMKAHPGHEPQTFSAYTTWASTTEYSNDTENDSLEYPMTEAAGIDWKYAGPEQEKIDDSKTYKPGGHFLAISCFYAQSNIKTWVNLSRICEAGVSMSDRKYVPQGRSNMNVYTSPTGVISNEEIIDPEFRSMFATMNHNRLRGKLNEATGRFEYNFMPLWPNGFDGALGRSNYLPDNEYNKNNYTTHTEDNSYINTKTTEYNNGDYLAFRLGIDNDDEIAEEKRWYYYITGQTSGVVTARKSFPMYENSFYFYFGLHDGATALDKFYEKFYAECPKMQSTIPITNSGLYIAVTANVFDICDFSSYSGGTATVQLSGPNVPTNTFNYVVKKDGNVYLTGTESTTKFTINKLVAGEYTIEILEAEEAFTIDEDFLNRIGTTVTVNERTIRVAGQSKPTNKIRLTAVSILKNSITVAREEFRLNWLLRWMPESYDIEYVEQEEDCDVTVLYEYECLKNAITWHEVPPRRFTYTLKNNE